METVISFGVQYKYVWLKNIGDADCYVSAYPNIQAEEENVAFLPKGECIMIEPVSECIYVEGETTVECHAQNDAESPFVNAAGESGGGGDITVESITITTNGTTTAPSGKAYSPITVNVPQQVEIITRTNWDLLSEQQKQAKGFVAIQDSSTGFLRGDFVNGADYIQSNKYIPYTDEDKVLGVAYPDLFDASDNSWGYGEKPILYTGTGGKPTLSTQESAVYFPTNTSDVIGYVDLGMANTPFTAYIVMKAAASSPGRLLSCVNSTNNAYLIMFSGAGDNVSIDNWGNGTDLGVSAVSDYFVAAMTYQPQTGVGYVYNPANDNINSASKSVVACGRYLTIARTDIDPNVIYPAPTNVYIKYIAVVNEVETSTAIENNLRALYNEFVGE